MGPITPTIGPVDPGDPDLAELCAAQEAEVRDRYADLPGTPLKALDLRSTIRSWLARAETGEPVGAVVLTRGPDADGYATGEVKRLFVRPAWRERRIAGSLMGALTAGAVGLGLRRLVLATGPRQPEAVALYRRLGWRQIPNWAAYAEFAGVQCFERTLWVDPPALPAGRPVHHRPSARAIVLDREDRLLLTHNVMRTSDAFVRDHWALPGGGIEPGESARQAASRELAEETGLDGVELAGPVVRHDFWVSFPDSVLHQIEELWWGRSPSTRVERSGLHSDEDYLVGLRWWSLAELRAADAVTFPRLLADLVSWLIRHGTPSEPFGIVADSTTPPGRLVAG